MRISKYPCDICGNMNIVTKRVYIRGINKKNKIFIQEEYSEICEECGNLLYGYIRPLKPIRQLK